jgi:beta-lactamase class A
MKLGLIAAVLLLGVSSAASALAQRDASLETQLRGMIESYPGKVALFAKDLTSGKMVAIDADKPVQTASVIKLTVLYTALEQVRAGRVHLDDKITLNKKDQVQGSGMLMFLDTPVTLTFKDVLTMMIIVSDNTATNLAIDHLGLKTIDDQIVSIGLKDTWLYKKVYTPAEGPMPADQAQFGLGKTTAREMASVMQRFVACDLNPPGTNAKPTPVDEQLCAVAMHMLKSQFYRESIPRYLETVDTSEQDTAIANKTGALDAVRNDVGVVFARHGTIVLSLFTYDNKDQSWTVDNEGEVLMARFAKTIVDTWTADQTK